MQQEYQHQSSNTVYTRFFTAQPQHGEENLQEILLGMVVHCCYTVLTLLILLSLLTLLTLLTLLILLSLLTLLTLLTLLNLLILHPTDSNNPTDPAR
jgi:hypothetical protein